RFVSQSREDHAEVEQSPIAQDQLQEAPPIVVEPRAATEISQGAGLGVRRNGRSGEEGLQSRLRADGPADRFRPLQETVGVETRGRGLEKSLGVAAGERAQARGSNRAMPSASSRRRSSSVICDATWSRAAAAVSSAAARFKS